MERPFKDKRPVGPLVSFSQSNDMFGDFSDEQIFVNIGSPELPGFGDSREEAETTKLDSAAAIEADINEEVFSGRSARIDVSDAVFMGFISMRLNDSDIATQELMQIKEIVTDRLGLDKESTMVAASCDGTPSDRFKTPN